MSSEQTCLEEGCMSKVGRMRDHCGNHYYRNLLGEMFNFPLNNCKEPGCTRDARYDETYCREHIEQVDNISSPSPQQFSPKCMIIHCRNKPETVGGFCTEHSYFNDHCKIFNDPCDVENCNNTQKFPSSFCDEHLPPEYIQITPPTTPIKPYSKKKKEDVKKQTLITFKKQLEELVSTVGKLNELFQ